MADLTKEQLRQQNATLFADNNSGNISAEDLRTFNNEVIDTLATENNPSFTGSVEVQGDVSASTYYGDGSNLTGVTSEVPQGTVSGSSQIDYPLISNIPSGIISSSEQLPSGLVSGSSQIVLEDTTYTDNGADSFLQTNGAGNLSFQYVKSMYEEIKNRESFEIQRGQALYVDSNTGDRVDVYLADNSNPNRFPATLIASENISPNGNGLGLIAGLIDSIDVGTLQSGDIVYLGTNGGWTNVRPTGSADIQVLGVVSRPGNNGAGYFINQLHTTLPNITEGNVWVGDASGVPVQVSTGSFGSSIDTGSFATTGSNTFTGDEIIQGTNVGPGSTLQVEDGNGTPRLSVNNATLKGFTGVDVIVNGNTLLDGTVAIDDATRINGNLENTGSFTNGGDTTIVGTTGIPANTFTVNDGNGTPRLWVQNSTLSGLTGIDVLVNGNQFVDGNISATGSLGIADNNFIISSGSNTVEFSSKFSDGQAGVEFTAANSKFQATGNFNIQSAGITGFDAPGGINFYNDTTLDRNGVVNGSNTIPGTTFQVKDGNNIPRLSVNNATLSGLVGNDIILNGTVLISETLQMVAQDPLPSGVVGELAVSGSNLYFYNGSWTQVV